jgi:hypothetical protein
MADFLDCLELNIKSLFKYNKIQHDTTAMAGNISTTTQYYRNTALEGL